MKKLIIFLIVLATFTTAYSQNTLGTATSTMTQSIKNVIEYYNNQDWENLEKQYADTVKVYEFPNTLRDSGLDELISHYPKTFA